MVIKPGFSERIFEFAFNAEFVSHHSGIVAACPFMPSLQEEKRLGYDVEFQLKNRSGAKESLFLQHKVARYVDNRTGSNKHFFDFAGGPYFAFTLDIDQYNLIQRLAAHRAKKIYYCAPLCSTRRDIDNHFLLKNVLGQSVWLDVRMCGPISDTSSHTIVYSSGGDKAALFSAAPQEIKTTIPSTFQPEYKEHPDGIRREEVVGIYGDLFEELQDWWPTRSRRGEPDQAQQDGEFSNVPRLPDALPSRIGDDASFSKVLEETMYLVSDWFQLTWLVLDKDQNSGDT